MNAVAEFVKALGPARIAAMGAVALILVGFFAFIMMRMNQPDMAALFSELSLQDSAQIVRELDRQAIRHELRNEGTTIMVPRADVPRLRMRMAEMSLPKGTGVGYEIFDRGETLGTTNFVQNINHLRALEGEIARSIRALDRVQAARVHLVLPERQLFSRDRAEPTASIVLRLRGQLETPQIRAIQHLVSSAVNGLKPTNVSIIDDSGRLLAQGGAAGSEMAGANSMEERTANFERRMQGSVEDILGRIMGPGRTRVQVAADLDFNRTTQTQDLFDPESRVVRSTQSRGERSRSNEAGNRQVSVGNELPGAQGGAGNEAGLRENSEKTEEITNFEISRTQRTEVIEAGRVKRLSVAVLVDGIYTRQGADVTYTPRSAEELERIATLVRSTIGFDERRGDRVEVVNLRFADGPRLDALPAAAEAPLFDFRFGREEIVRLIELGVMSIIGLLLLLFGVRPLMKSVLGEAASKKIEAQQQAAALAGPGEQQALQAPQTGQADQPQPALPDSATARALEVAAMLGGQHQASVSKLGELVKANPIEASAIVRAWMIDKKAA